MLANETRLSLGQAARQLDVHSCTVWRWCRKGVSGVKLEFWKIGGRTFTSAEAIERFNAAVTAAATGTSPAPTPAQTEARQARKKRIHARLAAAGL